MFKTIKYATLALACALALAACASTVELNRKDLLQHLGPLLALEDKYGQTLQLAKFLAQEGSDNKASELKEHADVYWIHYQAANVAIANGDLEGYEKHVEAAKQEVAAMDTVVNEWTRTLIRKKEEQSNKQSFKGDVSNAI